MWLAMNGYDPHNTHFVSCKVSDDTYFVHTFKALLFKDHTFYILYF